MRRHAAASHAVADTLLTLLLFHFPSPSLPARHDVLPMSHEDAAAKTTSDTRRAPPLLPSPALPAV